MDAEEFVILGRAIGWDKTSRSVAQSQINKADKVSVRPWLVAGQACLALGQPPRRSSGTGGFLDGADAKLHHPWQHARFVL